MTKQPAFWWQRSCPSARPESAAWTRSSTVACERKQKALNASIAELEAAYAAEVRNIEAVIMQEEERQEGGLTGRITLASDGQRTARTRTARSVGAKR